MNHMTSLGSWAKSRRIVFISRVKSPLGSTSIRDTGEEKEDTRGGGGGEKVSAVLRPQCLMELNLVLIVSSVFHRKK